MDDPQAHSDDEDAVGERPDDAGAAVRTTAAPTVDEPSMLGFFSDAWTDDLTGADGPRFWARLIAREAARVRRYRRPATVAFVELGGLDRLARQWGNDVAEQALRMCGKALAKEARTSDYLARVETARFAILLTETAEIAAINFVERARVACERSLGATGGEVKIGFGWASPTKDGDLANAVEQARTRLTAELASSGSE